VPKRRLIWQLFPLFVLVSFGSILAAGLYATQSLRQFYLDRSVQDLESRAYLVRELLGAAALDSDQEALQARCTTLGAESKTRITIVAKDGKVIADSDADPATMELHATRPEILSAIRGETGFDHRLSATTRSATTYVAVPLLHEGVIVGAVRVASPQFSFIKALGRVYWEIVGGVVFITALVALLSLAATRRITNPIEDLKKGAERYARGELVARLRMPESQEMGQLADAMNTMAAQLEDRIRAVERQRNELDALFSSMVEGVIAVDTTDRVININLAAAKMFDVDRERALGRDIREVIRNVDLHRFVAVTLQSDGPCEAETSLHHRGEQNIRLHGSPLRDTSRRNIGCVVVMHDVTALNRLEKARRDFVANVSHELKTPITSIKGYVETLLDGALEDSDSARRFLGTIGKQADRLHSLIEDLLRLSRIEQDGEKKEIELVEGPIQEILEAAVQACGVIALSKDIRVHMRCEEFLWARRNPALLQTAIENLLDNAIKYSQPGSEVHVSANLEEGSIRISVRDEGCGIDRQHLGRIFERFYRVDKARSRKLGGTGLGLAIVKHVVRVHGGQTGVESAPQKGSVFTILLPAIPYESRVQNVV